MLVTMSKEEIDESKTNTEKQRNGSGYNTQQRTYWWRKNYFPTCPTKVNENSFSPVPDDVALGSPLKYFKQFWDDEITNMSVKQANFYSINKSGVNINIYKDEVERL